MPENESAPRHPYVPTFSFGNVMSVVTICLAGVGVWIALQTSVARADEKIASTQDRVASLELQARELSVKVQQVQIQQAVALANIEMLVRAEGMQPVKLPSEQQ